MNGLFEQLATGLAERTSRRGAIGRIGRGVVVLGAAAAGVTKLSPALAGCFTCIDTGGACSNGVPVACGGTGTGNCTGNITSTNDPNLGCDDFGEASGYVWWCCGFDFVGRRCQDCCEFGSGLYTRTISWRTPGTC